MVGTYGTVGNWIYTSDWPCVQQATVQHLLVEMTKKVKYEWENIYTPSVVILHKQPLVLLLGNEITQVPMSQIVYLKCKDILEFI